MTCSWWEGLSNKPRRFGPISLVLGAEEIWPPFSTSRSLEELCRVLSTPFGAP